TTLVIRKDGRVRVHLNEPPNYLRIGGEITRLAHFTVSNDCSNVLPENPCSESLRIQVAHWSRMIPPSAEYLEISGNSDDVFAFTAKATLWKRSCGKWKRGGPPYPRQTECSRHSPAST